MRSGSVFSMGVSAVRRAAASLDGATPSSLFARAGHWVPRFGWSALLLGGCGLALGLLSGPQSQTAADSEGLVVLLLPVVWMSIFLYVTMLFWIGVGWRLNTHVPVVLAKALAPTGALFAFLAFWVGGLWFKASDGVWMPWNASLVFELVLLILYLIYLGLQIVIEDRRWADRSGAILIVAGALCLPVLCLQVLHLDAALAGLLGRMARLNPAALAGMLLVWLGLWAYSITAVLMRARCILLEQERQSHWVGAYAKGQL